MSDQITGAIRPSATWRDLQSKTTLTEIADIMRRVLNGELHLQEICRPSRYSSTTGQPEEWHWQPELAGNSVCIWLASGRSVYSGEPFCDSEAGKALRRLVKPTICNGVLMRPIPERYDDGYAIPAHVVFEEFYRINSI